MSLVPMFFAALLLPSLAAAGTHSKLWGKNGELWSPRGRLPDFSYAGYKQGNEPLPLPPVTRSVLRFRKPGMSDTGMLQAALAWAHSQPVTDRHIVLEIPPGAYTLTERLWIKRSRLVLRGAGAGKTVFYIPKSLRDIYGPNPDNPRGAFVNTGGFVTIKGSSSRGKKLARVSKSAKQGDDWVQVDDPRRIKAGLYYDLWWTDVAGKFNDNMFDDLWNAPSRYDGSTRVKFTTKVLAVRGNRIKIERFLPYQIRSKLVVVVFYAQPDTVIDSGVEGLTFRFKWSPYAGHHLEDGWNAVEVSDARDCWVRDIASVNADSTVLVNGASSITVQGVRISATKTRANSIANPYNERTDSDGHWGIQHTHSFDVMAREVVVTCMLLHDVGTGSSGKFSVFMNIRMSDGNLDLHRALAGPTLYTNIDVGKGSDALLSGGPPRSGPNALGGTTWWNIKSDVVVKPNDSDKRPGDCSYGPAINLVNVNIMPTKARAMCSTWWYERSVSTPENLYEAQYAYRMHRAQRRQH